MSSKPAPRVETFMESFERRAGVAILKVTTEDTDALRAEVARVFGAHANRRNLIQQDLVEAAVWAAGNARFGHLLDTKEGLATIARVTGDMVAEMVAERLNEVAKFRRR